MPKKTNTSRKGYKAAAPPPLKREPSVGETAAAAAAAAAAVDVKSVAPSELFGGGSLGQRIRLALADALMRRRRRIADSRFAGNNRTVHSECDTALTYVA